MIDKLDYLLALARERHFGRAAESCGVTQPSFSAGIRVLEEMLGMPVVERSSRFRGFTPEGERVLEWARRILGDVHAMRADVGALKHSLTGLLRIAAIPTVLATITELTTPYRARHPNVRFSIQSCTSNEVLRRLENFEVDAGVTYLDNESIGRARMIPLYEERYRLLTSADALLGHREHVSWSELGDIPLCLLTPDMQNRRILDRLLQNAGVTIEPTLESNSIVVLVSHVQTGRWACILPEKLARIFGLTEKLRIIPIINPEEVHTVGLVLPDRDPLSPLVAALATLARERGSLD
ncbi:MAG TPA: LysR family transcriptional regulator [Acidiphilium sp.]|nr:MAG: LysR family transcriptional regulator [Acidiphilium sp. 21-60-14]OYV89881.1 MAG: LysR family transcriptional regulator [Acidiphilium sp. 37-60-79]HQT88213.1 LysR family transcriptional regulator [Acidiphilium sp.]HQU23419.1 LysR family transcriptional regulator [Acidiphilium sp.]